MVPKLRVCNRRNGACNGRNYCGVLLDGHGNQAAGLVTAEMDLVMVGTTIEHDHLHMATNQQGL